jgi:hypothetical protein
MVSDFFFAGVVLKIKHPRVSHMLGKYSTTELHPCPWSDGFLVS